MHEVTLTVEGLALVALASFTLGIILTLRLNRPHRINNFS
jgi:hypothetical protein